MDLDWEKIAPEVAVQILGEPSKKDGSYYRWGSKGSLALNLEQGTFFDFENNQGYGLIEFIKNNGLNPDDFLKGYEPVKPTKPTRSFTDKEMYKKLLEDNSDLIAELVSKEHGKTIDDAKGSLQRG